MLRKICINGPQTQSPPAPAAQVLGWLFECERTQVSHSFALLKQVRWWEEPAVGWNYEYRRLEQEPRLQVRRMHSFVSFRFKLLGFQTKSNESGSQCPMQVVQPKT